MQEPYYLKFTKKAEAGDAYAQFNLGLCYFGGLGVGRDKKEAVKWQTKAAEQGNAGAQGVLGLWYFDGLGVGKDEKEAVKWYTKAAQQGDESAKKELEKLKSK